jgi:threonine dehydratase
VTNHAVSLKDVVNARAIIQDRVLHTPLVRSFALSDWTGMPTFLKAENLQVTGSFKVRGALNRIESLLDDERARGVVTFSAGNHALALAWAARQAGVPATVVMPLTADPSKVNAAHVYGAQVVQSVDFVRVARDLQAERGLILVHPFDDPAIIAGQGTLGLELVEDLPDVGTVVLGVGGGGLISGCAVAIRAKHPRVRIIGVEPQGANTMALSIEAGHAIGISRPDTVADGLAPPFAGTLTYAIVRDLVDEVVVVPDDAIIEGMRFLFESARLVAEPAGAAATGAVLAGAVTATPPVVVVISGGNISLDRFKLLLKRPHYRQSSNLQ